jgi:hypothetical protein
MMPTMMPPLRGPAGNAGALCKPRGHFKVVAVAFTPKYLSFSSVCSSSPELIAAIILRGAFCPEGSLLIFGVFLPNAFAFLVAQGALAAPARMRHP